MRLGIFGGTFDPIHWGHIRPVLTAAARLALDQVLYVPTAHPPHKPEQTVAPALCRFAMVELALLDYEQLRVSAFELLARQATYTIDTVEHLRQVYPEAELFLLVGEDSFNELHQWKRWQALVEATRLAVLARPGTEGGDRVGAPPLAAHLAALGRDVAWVESATEVSSSDIRSLLGRGEVPSEECLPRRVLNYCWKYRLYR